jgi:ureidoacrylate peracid hydrolase
MHSVGVRQHIVDRVMARRGRYHLFDALDPARTAFVIIDMINMFVEPGAPAEVPPSRGIVDNINGLTEKLRNLGARIIWITSPIMSNGTDSEWNLLFDLIVSDDMRERTMKASLPGSRGQQLWPELVVADSDFHAPKNRYSAMIGGSSPLERLLRSLGVDTVLIGGTKTNVCCESTARNAMMLDFNVVMVEDCNAALSDEEHQAALETIIQQFGDVMTADEILAVLSEVRT